MRTKILSVVAVLVVAVLLGLHFIYPDILENSMNKVSVHEDFKISEQAKKLHSELLVADLHTDSLLWKRDLTKRETRGHVDIPRLEEGNVALQLFTAVTKSPAGQNYEENDGTSDNITMAAIAQMWPMRTWDSLAERALYQSEKLHAFAKAAPTKIAYVTTAGQLQRVLRDRASGKKITAALYGIEGAHALDGKLENLGRLYDSGLRVLGPTHFFDNLVAGSLHGKSGKGLSEFGIEVIKSAMAKDMIIDIAHSSPQTVRDILAMTDKPVILSHGGMKGVCDTPRNLEDDLMVAVAKHGGLVGIGFWDGAVCDISPLGVVKAIRYAIDLLGVDHVALGSDYDGSTEVAFDISEIAILTQTMIDQGFTKQEISKVMGANAIGFFLKHLPS